MRHTPGDIVKMAKELDKYRSLLEGVEIWKEQSDALNKLRDIAGSSLNSDALQKKNDHERNVSLRHEVSRLWREAVAAGKQNFALELSFWIVKDWGRIKNVSDETIEKHHFAAVNKLFSLTFTHISSKSKVITLPDPYLYQIYDARVAVGLNVLQLAAQTETRIYFEIPSNQINWISVSKDCFNARLPKVAFLQDFGFKAMPTADIYTYYTRLLLKLGIHTSPQLDPIEVEMALFGLAYPFAHNSNGVLTAILSDERSRLRAAKPAD